MMEISSALAKLQAATVTRKAANNQEAEKTKQTENKNETTATQKKNQEINDKAIISKEAFELLKNCAKSTVKNSAEKSDLTTIVNKNISAKTYTYQKALKSYNKIA